MAVAEPAVIDGADPDVTNVESECIVIFFLLEFIVC